MSELSRRSSIFGVVLALAALLILGCAQDGSALVDDMLGEPDDDGPMIDDDVNPMANLAFIQANIFEVFCTQCHVPGGFAPFLPLHTQQDSCANLVGQATTRSPEPPFRVAPGDPDNSALVQRIEGTLEQQMPLGGPPLEDVNRQAIKDWIADGADCGLP